MDREWAELSPGEKREERFRRWLSPPGFKFAGPGAEKGYKERATRFMRALKLQEPDRVPCILPAGMFPAGYAGTNLQTVMYDYDELKRAWLKFLNEFDMDTYMGPALVPPGRALETLDYKLYKWPGHGLSSRVSSYQAVESEWMMAGEYDELIRDPSDFWLRTYLPRIFGALEPFRRIPPFTNIEEIAIMSFVPFGAPDVQASLEALAEAGRESVRWMAVVGEVIVTSLVAGYPGLMGGLSKAPFDTVGDTLRGTQGIMMDMFQRPDKLREALERIAPLTIRSAIASAAATGSPCIFMPLHKGADGFMSDKQFRTFYWPTLKKVVMGLADDGILPILFAEGGYNTRLDVIKELPRGAAAWYFDQTDMARAKQVLGSTACLVGNVPTSLLMTGQPSEVKERCRRLIETCGPGGGYILAGGANIDEGNPDNLRAMMEAAREYGVYK
ncbi:MAG TPA: uroporphyrinogen decarboxylase family protein [Dehalococcoidales bacterium]|nr:uroporphyrinogen decarboxylase family protein [Dehalococcoidales bacterium]